MHLVFLACLPVLVTAISDANPHFTFDELWALQNKIWNKFLYPANLNQLNATDTSIFTEDVQGRVDVTRTFDGRELNNEYIFGLFSEPEDTTLVGIPIAYNITQFSATRNIAAATTVLTFNATTFNMTIPVTIDSWILFNSDGKVKQYDAVFRWIDALFDKLFQKAGKMLNISDPVKLQSAFGNLLAEKVCKSHDTYCLGDNQQYASHAECMNFLTKKIRFGQTFEMGRNTLLCRQVHVHMVQFRPKEHCPHIGPTGGSYCVDDQDYEDMVLERYFHESFIPFGFGGKNIWVQ